MNPTTTETFTTPPTLVRESAADLEGEAAATSFRLDEVDPDPENPPEFRVLQAGEFYGANERKVSITEAELDSAVENFEADVAAGVEVPVDWDHSFAEGRGSRAAGWYRKLVRRGAELWASVEWTKAAREAIAADEFKFFSAEIARDHVTEDGTKRGFAVVSGGLTNRPYFRSLGTVALSATATDDLDVAATEFDGRDDVDPEAVEQHRRVIETMRTTGADYRTAANEVMRDGE